MKNQKTMQHKMTVKKDDVAYISTAVSDQKVFKTIKLKRLIEDYKDVDVEDYKGVDVMLDFSEEGVLLGIEILA